MPASSEDRYWTGLLSLEGEDCPSAPIKGKAWAVRFDQVNKHYRQKYQGRELVIEARKRATAQRALDLIWVLHQAWTGHPAGWPDPIVRGADEGATEREQAGWPFLFHATADYPEACKLAARASRRRDWTYAAALLGQSMRLHVNHPMDLEPAMFPFDQRSPLPTDHVRFAYAIVLAYAVIEQLGLDVRASANRPSMVKGKWNPEVLSELEGRLESAHVHTTEPVVWLVRGGKTRLEAKRPPQSLGRQPWSCGNVRDCEVAMVDAIADVSWLRSCVASHRMTELTGLLSVHDVANSQFLAQRLLLDVLGCWSETSPAVDEGSV